MPVYMLSARSRDRLFHTTRLNVLPSLDEIKSPFNLVYVSDGNRKNVDVDELKREGYNRVPESIVRI